MSKMHNWVENKYYGKKKEKRKTRPRWQRETWACVQVAVFKSVGQASLGEM